MGHEAYADDIKPPPAQDYALEKMSRKSNDGGAGAKISSASVKDVDDDLKHTTTTSRELGSDEEAARVTAANDGGDDDAGTVEEGSFTDRAGAGADGHEYRVYKKRWFGVAALTLLNIMISWDVSFLFNRFPACSCRTCCRVLFLDHPIVAGDTRMLRCMLGLALLCFAREELQLGLGKRRMERLYEVQASAAAIRLHQML